MEMNQKKENPATEKIEPICQKNCRVCKSDHIKEIHNLRNSRLGFREIVDIIKKKYDYDLSASGLCRHFQNYDKRRQIISAEIMDKGLVEESTEQARHTKKIIGLIDTALEHIEKHNVRFDVSDLEKLFKIRHQILKGDDSGEKNLLVIFNNAMSKYGVNTDQGVLFNRPKDERDKNDERPEGETE